MPNRNVEGDYRYAYQGQEKDPETEKEAFELRLWDSRIGRWLTTDPARQFASPYLGMGNNPISGVDPDGGYVYIIGKDGRILGALDEVVGTEIGLDEVGKFIDDPNNHIFLKDSNLGGNRRYGNTLGGPLIVDKQTTLNRNTVIPLVSEANKKFAEKNSGFKDNDTNLNIGVETILGDFGGIQLQPGNNFLILIDVEESLKNGVLSEVVFHEPAAHANNRYENQYKDHRKFSFTKNGLFREGRSEGTTLDKFLIQLNVNRILENVLNLVRFPTIQFQGNSNKVERILSGRHF